MRLNDAIPNELAPTAQEHLQWPMWGQYYENNRKGGEAPALPEAKELVELYENWRKAPTTAEREQIWLRMLEIHAQQVYTIGIVSQALQPIVAKNRVRNIPPEGLWSWAPGSYFGMYHPDTFWLETQGPR